jgi:hypothetical protein
MADVGAWGAAAAAMASAVTTVGGAFKGLADLAEVKKRVESIETGALSAIRKKIDEHAEILLLFPTLRKDVDDLAARFARYRDREREDKRHPTGSFPAIDSSGDMARRVAELEKRADKSDARDEKIGETMTQIQIALTGIVRDVAHVIDRIKERGSRVP